MEASDLVLHVSGKDIGSRSLEDALTISTPCHDMGSAGGEGAVRDPLSLNLESKLAAA